MACMEHECLQCGYIWFNNTYNSSCPECGSRIALHYFDECENTKQENNNEEEEEDYRQGTKGNKSA